MYCPRRYALIHIDDNWQENAFVVMANIMHNRVHSGEHKVVAKSKYELSDVYIYNDELDILGKADCIEFDRASAGVYVESLKDSFNIKIIEYKPTKPKNSEYNEADAIQVFAQKLCVDYIWKCNSQAYIYYADVKKRIKLPFDEKKGAYTELINTYLQAMTEISENNIIPARSRGQKCSGCSMKDICIPKNISVDMRKLIAASVNED
jgi:CRISPR-associated exonuclease Cas4